MYLALNVFKLWILKPNRKPIAFLEKYSKNPHKFSKRRPCQMLPIGSCIRIGGTFSSSKRTHTHTHTRQWFRSVNIHKAHTHICASSWKLQSDPVFSEGKSGYNKTHRPFGHWPDPLPHLPLQSLPASFSHSDCDEAVWICSEPTPHLSAFTTHHKSPTLMAKAEVKRPKGEFTDNELGSLILYTSSA